MRTNAKMGLLETDVSLANVLRKHLAVTRYAFGNMVLDQGEADPVFLLLKSNPETKKYRLTIIDVETVSDEFDRGECFHRQLSEWFCRKLIYGVAEYVLVTSEVGMFFGDVEATKRFRADIAKYGEGSEMVQQQVGRTISLILYDLSGVVARGFASEQNCVDTFMRYELDDLLDDLDTETPTALKGEKPCLSADMKPYEWVLDGRGEDEIRRIDGFLDDNIGPLRSWNEAVFGELAKISGVHLEQ